MNAQHVDAPEIEAPQLDALSANAKDRRAENLFALLLSPLVLLVALLKGLDGISTYGATQALIDYRFGLVKRGLIGALLGKPLHFEKLAHFYLFSLAVLALLLALLFTFGLFGGFRRRFASHTLLPLYFSSYAITYFAYCVGYNDAILFCLVIPLLFLRNSTWRLLAGLPIVVLGVLIHEIFLVLALPLLLLSFLIETNLRPDAPHRRALFLKAAALLVLTLGVTLRVALRPALPPAQIARFAAESARRADFPLNPEIFQLMGRSAADNVHLLWRNAHTASYWRRQAGTLITMFPNTLLLCLAMALALRSTRPTVPRWLWLACYAAALSPLALHLIAWDADRWNAETITTSLLVLILICRYTRGPIVHLSPRLRYTILFLIIFNISMRALIFESHTLLHDRPWHLPHNPSLATESSTGASVQ